MSLPSLSVNRPILANLFMILVIVAGVVSFQQMGQEIFPEMSMGMVSVFTFLPGASPKEVEQLLTIPLEEQIAKVDEIDQMISTSSENVSQIMVQFDIDVENVFEKVTEIQNQIEMVERFPEEAEPPDVGERKAVFEVISLGILGSAPESEVREFAIDLRDALKTIDGVAEVGVSGLREREIWVEVDPHRVQAYGLSLAEVAAALRNRNLNLPGGLIRLERGEFSVRTEAEFRNLEEILGTILRQDEEGYLYLRDVATVRDTFAERMTLARLDGMPSVNLYISKEKEANAIKIVDQVKAIVARWEERLPAGMQIKEINDTSVWIEKRLKALFQNFGVGLILVAASFTLAIGWRAALIITAGLPVAFLGAFVFLNARGYTINELVLFAMIIVLGLIVDDAIVVCENIYRHFERGMPLREAAIFGAEQITAPVVATVLTTVAAFLPLLLMSGMIGKFMGVIPVVVSLALLSSLLEAFFILPAHAYEWTRGLGARSAPKPRRWIVALTRYYEKVIVVALRRRYMVAASVLTIAAGAVFLGTRMDFVLFGGADLRFFSVAMEGRPGASFRETDRILGEIEDHVLDLGSELGDVEAVHTRGGYLRRGWESMRGTHVGQVSVELVDLPERSQSGYTTLDEVRRRVGEVAGARVINFEEEHEGPPVGKAVNVRVKGDRFETLREIVDEVKAYLHTVEGVTDIADNFPPGKDEIRPELDLKRVAGAGLDVRTIAAEIRGGFEGIEATRIYDGSEEVEVIVKYDEATRSSLANLAEMRFSTPAGMVPFSNLGTLKRQQGFSQIHHHDSRRNISVTADVQEGVITSQRANRLIMEHFSDLSERYPGYALEYGGEFEDTQESVASLFRAFFITVIVIYVILGALFGSLLQPLVVMCSVPFAFIGVVCAFYMLDTPLGMASLIGTIALTGIVVNDSLILIDFVNRRRAEGFGPEESLLRAGAARLRPIILTSVTTICGLLPMSLGLFGVDEMLKPMAVAIAWGLSFATVLTLVVIPCVYRIADDLSLRLLGHPLAYKHEPAEGAPRPAAGPEPQPSA